jgi:hypothetical protein
MIGKSRKWLTHRMRERDYRKGAAMALEDSWKGMGMMPPPADPAILKLLSDEALHGWLGRFEVQGDSRIGLERELRRREAWTSPAGRSAKIATAALVISILSILISAAALWTRS